MKINFQYNQANSRAPNNSKEICWGPLFSYNLELA